MRRLSVIGPILGLAVLVSTKASAQSYAVDFGGRDGSGNPIQISTGDTAGVVPQTWWNPDPGGTTFSGTLTNLTDQTGAASTVTLTYDCNDSWNNDTATASATKPNAIMMQGIIKANGGAGAAETFLFTGVPEGQYDLYVYTTMNGDGVAANVSDAYGLTTYYIKEAHQFADTNTFVQALNTDPNGVRDTGNYVKLANLGTYGRGTIGCSVVHVSGADGTGVAGLQLVKIGAAQANTNRVTVLTSPVNRRGALGASNVTFTATFQGPVFGVQWYRNGSPIPGATSFSLSRAYGGVMGSSFTPVISAADNGAQYYVVVSNNVNTAKSGTNVLTVGNLVLLPGAHEQLWFGSSNTRDGLETGALDSVTPDRDYVLPTFQTPEEQGDNYVDRLSAIFIAPVTGNYVFFVNSDDDSDLFLSTDDTPANKRLIAQETSWSASQNWTGNNGGAGGIPMKRSDQWTDINGNTPFANGIPLVAGTKYYLEADHHEGGGGDQVEATYKLVGEPDPATGELTKITPFVMAGLVKGLDGGFITITNQPQNVTVAQGQRASFTVGATSGYIGDASGATPGLFLQWQTAPKGSSTFTSIGGASGTSYTTPVLDLTNSGTQFRVTMIAGDATTNTTIAIVTVVNDTNPPVVLGTGALLGSTNVGVTFNKKLDAATAGNPANYKVNGTAPKAVTVLTNNPPNEFLVQLTVASGINSNFTLHVAGVKDSLGNAVTGVDVAGTVINLNYTDIGSGASDPGGPDPDPAALPAIVNVMGPGNIDVLCNGNDYWNNADGFNFLWMPKTNSFDVKVRVAYVQNIDNWTAGAIEVRDGPPTDNGGGWELARHYFCKVDYAGPDACLDGSGSGANQYEFNCRRAPGDPTVRETGNGGPGQSQGWGGSGPGGGGPVPFPNAWIRIARVRSADGSSDHLLGYRSSDGTTWDQREDVDLNDSAHAGFADSNGNPAGAWPSVCYVGLGSTSHTGVANNNDINPKTGAPYQAWISYRDFGDFAAVVPRPTLSLTKNADGTFTLTYSGKLYSASKVDGTYTVVSGATSPFKVDPKTAGAAGFYRAGP